MSQWWCEYLVRKQESDALPLRHRSICTQAPEESLDTQRNNRAQSGQWQTTEVEDSGSADRTTSPPMKGEQPRQQHATTNRALRKLCASMFATRVEHTLVVLARSGVGSN